MYKRQLYDIPKGTTVYLSGDLIEYDGTDVFITAREISWEPAIQKISSQSSAANNETTLATGIAPGTHGEATAIYGSLSECVVEDDFYYCEIATDNFSYLLLRDDRTSDEWFDALKAVQPGTPITAEIDVTAYGDTAIEAIPRILTWGYETTASSGGWASLINGRWGLPDDTSRSMAFNNGNYSELDDSQTAVELGQYEFGGTCNGVEMDLRIYLIGAADDPLCYSILELNQNKLTLSYVGARPWDFYYVRVD